MLKTRVNGTVRPEMDAGLRRGVAAAVVLLIVCVLAVGVVSADVVRVSSFDELQNNISTSGDRTIIVAKNIPITSQLIIDSGNITLTTDGTDHTLSRNCDGDLFTVNSGGSLTITGSGSFNLTLDGMKQSSSKSLVYVYGGNFTLADGGILTNNTAFSGGGVYVESGGTFTLADGGILTNNTAFSGGGVYVESGEFTMFGGTISENTASNYGGGVYVYDGSFTLADGGTISENTASYYGGGVYVTSSGEFKMSGGSISGNEAGRGGGVYVNSGTFTMSGGSISENTAFVQGGGVYVNNYGTFSLSGSGSTDSVYLTSGKSITVIDALTGTDNQVTGIELQSPAGGTTVVTGTHLEEDDLSRFELDPSVTEYELEYQSPDSIVLKLLPDCTVTFDANGGNPTSTMPFSRGEPISPPANLPTRDGYTLTGWYTEDTCQNLWDFTTPVDEDLILYAGWKKDEPQPSPSYSSGDGNMENAYRVLFNDGSTTLSVQTDLSSGDKLTKPETPVKDGYTFAGWYKDSACTQGWDFETGISGDMTLYAKWTAAGSSGETEATATATATATAVTTPQPTATQTTTATTSIPEATTAAAVSPTLVQTPAPVAGALFGLLAAGVLLRRRQ